MHSSAFGIGFFELLLVSAVGLFLLASFGFWLWMLVDCVQAPEKPGSNERLLWILIIALAGIIGALIYFFAIRMPRRSASQAAPSRLAPPFPPPAPPLPPR